MLLNYAAILTAFLTSISCSFGLQPLPTETPQSLTPPGLSWLMKRKHLMAREHHEGKRELWGSRNVKAACAGSGRTLELEKSKHSWSWRGLFPSTIQVDFIQLSSSPRSCRKILCHVLFFYFYSHKVVFKVCLASFLLISILSMPK